MENIQVLKYLDFEFIFDKEDTFMWVMQKGQALSMDLVDRLSKLFNDDELIEFIENNDDKEYKRRFNIWIDSFDLCKLNTINTGFGLYRVLDEKGYKDYIDNQEQCIDYKFLQQQHILELIF